MSGDFGTANVSVPRHGRNGNPLVLLPEFAPNPDLAAILLKRPDERSYAERNAVKGKCEYYARASGLGKAIEDSNALTNWKIKMALIGVSQRPDLLLSVAAHATDLDENWRVFNDIREQAIEAAKASTAANTGTALHKLTELVDRGVAMPVVNAAATRDLDAYRNCMTRYGVRHLRAEQFVVCDELQVAGTFDRFMQVTDSPGEVFVGDIKTGNVAKKDGVADRDKKGVIRLAYANSIAVQLAVYANSMLYDPLTGGREPLGVSTQSAIVIHLPQGTGECELHWLDIAAGWEAAGIARWVRGWQSRQDLTAAFGGAA